MADKEYNIKIKINGEEVANDLNKIGNSADKSSAKIKDGFDKTKSSVSSLGSTAISAIGPIGVALAVVAGAAKTATIAFDMLKVGIADAAKEESVVNKLNNTLKITGTFSKELSDEFVNFADTLEKTTGVEAEAILNQITLAKQLGYTNEQAKSLTTSALKLSQTMGVDFQTANQQLLATLTGSAGKLAKLNPEIKNMTEEQLKAGAAIDYFNRKGLALNNNLQTTEGKIGQANIAFGDITKSIGKLIIDTPEFSKAIIDSTKAFASIVKEIETGKGVFGTLANIVAGTVKIVSKGVSQIASSFDTTSVKAMTNEIRMLETQIKSAQKTGQAGYVFMSDNEIAEKTKRINELKKSIQDAKSAADYAGEVGTPKNNFNNDTSKEDARLARQEEIKAAKLKAIEEQKALDAQNLAAMRTSQAEYEALLKSRVDLETNTNNAIMQSKLAFFAQANEATRTNRELFTEQEAEDFALMLETYTAQDATRLMQLQQQVNAEVDLEKQKTLAKQFETEQRLAIAKKEADVEKQMSDLKLATASQAISTGLAFAKKGTREHKNLMRAQILMNTYTAATQALSSPPGPPWTIGLAALITAQGLSNLKNVDNQKFANGGIFNAGGSSITGDNNLARINDREMILNLRQQKNLFDSINGGNIGNGLSNELLLDIRDSIRMQQTEVNLDGEKLNSKLDQVKSRRLGV